MNIEELNLTEEVKEKVEKLIQAEADRVRTEYSKKVKELEKYKPEEENEITKKLKELEDREKELNKRDSVNKITESLKNKGLDGQLTKFLNLEGVNDLETYIQELTEVINKQTNGYIPKNHKQSNGITKEEFEKMNYTERVNLYNTDKELYNILSK